MGLFKKLNEENIMFTKKGEHKYKLVLALESNKDSIIITYLDQNIKRKFQITEKSIDDYKFIQRTKNFFYKKYVDVDPKTIIKEMVTGDAGVGGTAPDQFSSDFYAPGDARNLFGTKSNKKPPMVRRNFPETIMKQGKKKKKKKGGSSKKEKN
jgi:hypothetical protein